MPGSRSQKRGSDKSGRQRKSRSWDAVAGWYAGWSGPEGSHFHKTRAIPAILDLLDVTAGERVLDIGCGAGALASSILRAKAHYVGVDLSAKLIRLARQHYKNKAEFLVGDATRLKEIKGLDRGSFDAAAYLLSIQDINPLDDTLSSAAWMLKPGGRLAILMTHPCFRIPRQSGWGTDEGRKLKYRRIDKYLSALDIPMQEYGGSRQGVTRSYHRPLQDYFEALRAAGFAVERLVEIPAPPPKNPKQEKRADRLAREDIPLFLGLRAVVFER